jgi:acyl-CoA carboxylase subunit beta
MKARDLLAVLLDPGTFRSWDGPPLDVRPDPAYAADLARARQATGLDESVITGEGTLGGRRIAVAASEFGFLGGSIGRAAGERLTAAIERATAERLPLIAAPASGGTRMQEGTRAFMQMVKITAAVVAHKSTALPYLVYLRHPTTGGVFASWASLGHLTLAEPGALIGFLGPRVYEALRGSPVPDGVQTAENLLAHGVVDAVVPGDGLGAYLGRVLAAIAPASREGSAASDAAPGIARDGPAAGAPAWESVLRTRQSGRPGAGGFVRAAATGLVPVRESGLLLALGRVGRHPCVFIGQHKVALTSAMLRTARRGMRLAEELGIPLVTVIDTPGAELSREAEEEGIAAEIAHCIAALIGLATPTVSVLLGQGTGGAALALLPADRVLAAEHAWLAPLAPEGASVIVYKDATHAPELAALQGIRAPDLAANGIVDRVIAEEAGDFRDELGQALRAELDHVTGRDDGARMRDRLERYRHAIG